MIIRSMPPTLICDAHVLGHRSQEPDDFAHVEVRHVGIGILVVYHAEQLGEAEGVPGLVGHLRDPDGFAPPVVPLVRLGRERQELPMVRERNRLGAEVPQRHTHSRNPTGREGKRCQELLCRNPRRPSLTRRVGAPARRVSEGRHGFSTKHVRNLFSPVSALRCRKRDLTRFAAPPFAAPRRGNQPVALVRASGRSAVQFALWMPASLGRRGWTRTEAESPKTP
jgi:hypothetical protein